MNLLEVSKTKIMGILNITPDSFSGDGLMTSSKNVLTRHLQKMIVEGADIIDIGARSTAPGAKKISEKAEIGRLKTFCEYISLADFPKTIFSVDTMSAAIAEKGISCGVQIINDVSGGRNDSDMFNVIANSQIKYIMMYCKNTDGYADTNPVSYDVYKKIIEFFDDNIKKALKTGIRKEQLLLDPGMGAFISSDFLDSVKVLQKIPDLKKRYQLPICIGSSRKGFLANLIGNNFNMKDRLIPTVITSLFSVIQGAEYVRVHDILAMKNVLRSWEVLNENLN